MSQTFCKACGGLLGEDAGFCELCGAAVVPYDVNTSSTVPCGTQSSVNPLQGIGCFFASQAYLSLVTLLVFCGLLIALAPVGLGYLRMQARQTVGQTVSRGLGNDTGQRRCSPIEVYFTGAASVTQVAALLESLSATIVLGPTENGSFEISASSASALAVTEALNNATELVLKASLRPRCLEK